MGKGKKNSLIEVSLIVNLDYKYVECRQDIGICFNKIKIMFHDIWNSSL